jgi:hypothetical protein
VLGYVSDAKTAPGKFRAIEVKVKRPGLKVRARRGYVPADFKSARRDAAIKPGTSPALAAALTNPVPVSGVPFRVWAAPFKGSGKLASVSLAVEVDGAALKYRNEGDRFLEDLELSIVAAAPDGKIRGSDRQTMKLKLKPETHQIMTTGGGVRMLSRIDLPPARYQFRVGVHESTGGAIGSVPIDVEVPDYSKTPFAVSGLVLTSTTARKLVTIKPDPVLKDVLPLPPVALRTFAGFETVSIFAEIYDRSTPSAHDVDVTVSVHPKRGGAAVFTSSDTRKIEASGGTRTLGYTADIPLRDLPPGEYILRLNAKSRAGDHTATREVPFAVAAVGPSITNIL